MKNIIYEEKYEMRPKPSISYDYENEYQKELKSELFKHEPNKLNLEKSSFVVEEDDDFIIKKIKTKEKDFN